VFTTPVEAAMTRLSIALALLLAPIAVQAAPADEAQAADRTLEAASTALPTPGLSARLQARAAAYRVAIRTAEGIGLVEQTDAARITDAAPAAPVVVAVRTERD